MRRFRVERELGRGGFGRVLLARELGPVVVTPVAIKLAQGMWRPCPDDARRARDEARLLASLDHPAIVRLQSLIQTEHGPALILEYVPGLTLHQILRLVERLPVVPSLELVAEVADALEAGWSQPGPLGEPLRLLHRDIKPGNLMITPRGAVKVLDFGIAKAARIGREVKSGPVPVGTTDYMAPERSQRAGQPGAETPAGDIFSLGLVLFGALTGAFHGGLPYEPEGWALLREDFIAELTEALAGQALADEIAALVLDMTDVDPWRRPDPATTRDRAFALARDLGGEGLRPWAARALAGLPTPKPEALSGYAWKGQEIVEIVGEQGAAEAAPEPVAPTRAAVASQRAARGRLSRRRPVKLVAPMAPETWDALGAGLDAEPGPPIPASADALEPVPMPVSAPPPRSWRPRALVALGLLALALGLGAPDPVQPAAPPAELVAVAPPVPDPVSVQPAEQLGGAPTVEPVTTARLGLLHRRVHVGLSGEAERASLLTSRGEIPLPAEVRAGTYGLRVTFPGEEPIDIQGIALTAGERWEIRCSAAIMQCREIVVP